MMMNFHSNNHQFNHNNLTNNNNIAATSTSVAATTYNNNHATMSSSNNNNNNNNNNNPTHVNLNNDINSLKDYNSNNSNNSINSISNNQKNHSKFHKQLEILYQLHQESIQDSSIHFQREINDLRELVASLKGQLNLSHAKIHHLENELHEKLEKQRHDIEEKEKQRRWLEDEHERIKKQEQNLYLHENSQLKAQLKALETEKNGVNLKLETLQIDHQVLKESFSSIQNENQQWKSKYSKLKDEYQKAKEKWVDFSKRVQEMRYAKKESKDTNHYDDDSHAAPLTMKKQKTMDLFFQKSTSYPDSSPGSSGESSPKITHAKRQQPDISVQFIQETPDMKPNSRGHHNSSPASNSPLMDAHRKNVSSNVNNNNTTYNTLTTGTSTNFQRKSTVNYSKGKTIIPETPPTQAQNKSKESDYRTKTAATSSIIKKTDNKTTSTKVSEKTSTKINSNPVEVFQTSTPIMTTKNQDRLNHFPLNDLPFDSQKLMTQVSNQEDGKINKKQPQEIEEEYNASMLLIDDHDESFLRAMDEHMALIEAGQEQRPHPPQATLQQKNVKGKENLIDNISTLLTSGKKKKISQQPGKQDGEVVRGSDVNYQFLEVVRNKSERKKLHAHDCECCKAYYQITKDVPVIQESGIPQQRRIQSISRHRSTLKKRPSTPPGFWDVDFPLSQESPQKSK